MPLEDFISTTISRLMRRLVRRGIAMAVLALFILVATYQLTVAGTVALEELYGPLYARLIIVGAYAVLAAGAFAYLFATRIRPPVGKPVTKTRANGSRTPPDVRIALLLESLLLGYTAGRRKSRHS
jgi:hypothetical protein